MWMPAWIIIVIVLVVFFILIIRASDTIYILQLVKEKFFYVFLIFVFAFLAISLTHIHSTYDINFGSSEGIGKAMKIYWGWLVNVVKNVGRVTGFATKQDWFSANVTNATN